MAGERTYRGEVLPELKADVLRLYSMKFCPFAQRTRLVLHHKNIPFETINVDLVNKPDWFFEKSSLGLVPVLERNGEIILESLYCNEWLEETFPGGDLKATNKVDHFKWKNNVAIFEAKVMKPFYGVLMAQDDEAKKSAKEKLQAGLNWVEEVLGDESYFAGERVGYVDYSIYPWTERMFDLSEYNVPKFLSWVNRMQQLPAVKQTMVSKDTHIEFFRRYRAAKSEGGTMDYDFGLPTADN